VQGEKHTSMDLSFQENNEKIKTVLGKDIYDMLCKLAIMSFSITTPIYLKLI